MDYTQACRLALEGKEEGFRYLYDKTYQSKYHYATTLMNREADAQDLLQDAYLKAFSNLDKLKDPEHFPTWLGTIIHHTAINRLKDRKQTDDNALSLSWLEGTEDDDRFEPSIPDHRDEVHPEASFSKKETRELVHELINSLSDEQRMCILMFEIEGVPIRQIAEMMGCSENTVKSRLNYGRKNLRKKAEELKMQGYTLFGLAPVPLLLLLLQQEERYLAADGILGMAQAQAADSILSQIPALGAAAPIPGPNVPPTPRPAPAPAPKGFLHTAAAKATAVALSAAIAGGAAGVAYHEAAKAPPVPTETIVQTQQQLDRLEDLYRAFLLRVRREGIYSVFPTDFGTYQGAAVSCYGKVDYFFQDLDGDQIPELILGAECTTGRGADTHYCLFYGYELTAQGYVLRQLGDYRHDSGYLIPKSGHGLLIEQFHPENGGYDFELLTASGSALETRPMKGSSFCAGSQAEQDHLNTRTPPNWLELIPAETGRG